MRHHHPGRAEIERAANGRAPRIGHPHQQRQAGSPPGQQHQIQRRPVERRMFGVDQREIGARQRDDLDDLGRRRLDEQAARTIRGHAVCPAGAAYSPALKIQFRAMKSARGGAKTSTRTRRPPPLPSVVWTISGG